MREREREGGGLLFVWCRKVMREEVLFVFLSLKFCFWAFVFCGFVDGEVPWVERFGQSSESYGDVASPFSLFAGSQ